MPAEFPTSTPSTAWKRLADLSAPLPFSHAPVRPSSPPRESSLSNHQAAAGARKNIYPWKVVHACEQARDVLMLVEAELAVGMRPFLVTPRDFGAGASYLHKPQRENIQPVSLMQAWNHVRNWKRLLAQSDPERAAEVVHAHSFAAGMAAVRSDAPVIYDLSQTVERRATEAGQCREKSWIGRSFRVAEQFVLTRAGAVVVHDNQLRNECLERGVAEKDLFLIPYPIDAALFESVPDRYWFEKRIGAKATTVIFFVPLSVMSAPELEKQISILMAAFSQLHSETEHIKLVFMDDENAGLLLGQADAHNIGHILHLLPQREYDLVFSSCDVVIALQDQFVRPAGKKGESPVLLEAIARGRVLLAAGTEEHRNLLPARSCLWFHPENVHQLGHRAAFLARNPDFCRVMSATARESLLKTRSFSAIGELYDEVYAHATAARKQRNGSSPDVQLVPLQANL